MNYYWLVIALLMVFPGEPAKSRMSDSLVSFESNKVKGISFVAPRNPFSQDPMIEIRELGVDWIAAIPYGFTRLGNPQMIHDTTSSRQWWGEKPPGTRETIRLAHASGIKVMLKPQVWIPGSWPGGLDFDSESEWEQWEKGYREYIMIYARIAQQMGAELFCVGTEFKVGVVKREAFWRHLIQEVREVYSGKLTYASNWDEFPHVPFWDALDIIGIDAYFPLSDEETPSVEELVRSWAPVKERIEVFSKEQNRPVLFTEYGYLSVSGCAGKTWILEKDRAPLTVNEQAQANAVEALYETYWGEDWWLGGFIWKWYPTLPNRPGRREKDYTPQGKLAQEVMREWFRR